jgi:hypothetical protein
MGAVVKQVFLSYCGAKNQDMEGKSWAKLAKDTKILDKKLTATDIDLIFAKVKTKSERRITWEQFTNGLQLCAEKKGVDVNVVFEKVAASKGPVLKGTAAEKVALHDDKSNYTGVYAQGGPTNVDKDIVHDISQTVNRNPADVRGTVTQQEMAAVTHGVAGVVIHDEKPAAAKPKAKAAAPKQAAVQGGAGGGSLAEIFASFAKGKEMDGKTFSKFSKDCKVIDKKCSATDIDLIFAKVKNGPAARKIVYAEFTAGLELVAAKKGMAMGALEESICKAGGPVFTGTKAEANKFHDDKSLYTGVYANGGPSSADGKISDLSQLADRSSANVRGTK